ncbi:MAG: hypothetical protein R3Y35_11950 [Clostridia bacterium]
MKRKILFLLSVISIIVCTTACSNSNLVVKDLIYLENESCINIIANWDSKEPDLILISPNGDEIDLINATENMRKDDTTLLYSDKNLMAGQWKIACDKKSNENVSIYCGENYNDLN